MKWLRKLRGIIGMGLLWGVIWGLLGFLLGTLQVIPAVLGLTPLPFIVTRLISSAFGWGIWGGLSGATFGGALMIAEGRRSLTELSVARIGFWGALGGLTLPVLVALAGFVSRPGVIRILPGFALAGATLGAASAVSMLWVARRASRGEAAASGEALLSAGLPELDTKLRSRAKREKAGERKRR
jgi:hypothetical protein